MNEKNLYREAAGLYDLDVRNVVSDDIPFYLELAEQQQGEVLELACGTGRVSIIPFRGFQALADTEQPTACLRAVHRHLDNAGLFVVNVFRPYGHLDQSWVQPEKLDWETVDPRTGYKVRRTNIAREIDTVNQIIYPELMYYVTNLKE